MTREKPQRVADEIRELILSGRIGDGALLGREPELIERFGVSRPSLREALRILESEGLVTVARGAHGGVIARRPDERMPARGAAMVLRSRHVTLADVYQARSWIEPIAVRAIAMGRGRRAALKELRALVDAQRFTIDDPEAFSAANARFHQRLVALAGNRTLSVVVEMLNEIVAGAATAARRDDDALGTAKMRRRALRSQERLLDLMEAGDGIGASEHWHTHMHVVGRALSASKEPALVDLLDH